MDWKTKHFFLRSKTFLFANIGYFQNKFVFAFLLYFSLSFFYLCENRKEKKKFLGCLFVCLQSVDRSQSTKKVFIFDGLSRQTDLSNIKSVKMRRSLFCRDRGTIRLKLKKGISLGYALVNIPEVDKVYHLLLEKIR